MAIDRKRLQGIASRDCTYFELYHIDCLAVAPGNAFPWAQKPFDYLENLEGTDGQTYGQTEKPIDRINNIYAKVSD